MFTDMVGYTALGQRNESLSLALVDEQRRLVRPILARHGGREVKTIGDAFLVEFPNALDAVRCAYDIQRGVKEFNIPLPEERRLHLRIGVHLGDVVESQGDISGDAVNVASRIEPLADNGGVCLTSQVFESVRGKIELEMKSLGPKTLKNISVPMEVYKVLMPWGEGSGAGDEEGLQSKRLAVLPFRNMSPDPNDEYFAEGMTEELISTISKVRELTVISRTSVMRYRNQTVPISQIARELRVGSVLEGSVRKAGNKVRITAQLIDVQSDGHLWSQSYDKELTDIFAIQSDIAEQIADSLKVQLMSGERRHIRDHTTTDLGAYTLYLKGRYYWNERTEEGAKRALRYFEEAVKLDSAFAMAYSGLADVYSILSDYGWMNPAEALPLAKANATKAVEVDATLAEAHASLGLALTNYDWNLDMGERELRKAIELKPNYAPAHHWYALTMFYTRRYAENADAEKHAIDLDPYSRTYNMSYTNRLLLFDQPRQAAEAYEKLVTSYPEFPAMRFWKSICHALAGDHERAIKEAIKFVELDESSWNSKLNLGWVYAVGGYNSEAMKIASEATAASERIFVGPTQIGLIKLALGLREDGFAWLERALRERDPSLLYFNAFPWLKEFRKDPRWAPIEARLGFKSMPE